MVGIARPLVALGCGWVRMASIDVSSKTTGATPQGLIGKLRPRVDRAFSNVGSSPHPHTLRRSQLLSVLSQRIEPSYCHRKKKKKLRDHKLPMVPFQRGEEPHSSKWFPSKEEKSHILSRGFGVTTSRTETSSLPMTPGYFGMGLTHTLPELTGCNWVVISSQAFRVSVIYTKVTCQLLIVFLKAIHNVNFQMLHLYLSSSC